ncbi:MAG: alpha/beta fold hydrolase [Cyanobacteria bacterium P01_H01_bin.15]
MTEIYNWQGFSCAYEVHGDPSIAEFGILLIHPIGVGLSRRFWDRLIEKWSDKSYPLYNLDLLGCGESDFPKKALYPADWAAQLAFFVQAIAKKPMVILAQGALFPVALKLTQKLDPKWLKGLISSGPPAWATMTRPGKPWQQKLLWNLLFSGPTGQLFYRYARRRNFLASFSLKQLFADKSDVTEDWLAMLEEGAADLDSRFAVFSFLAGFWREDYGSVIQNLPCQTLILFGDQASSISQEGKIESAEDRIGIYQKHLSHGKCRQLPGRNVLPYESTAAFIQAMADFLLTLSPIHP